MMIGVDVSALVKPQPTGVELYVQSLLGAMMQTPLASSEQVVLYAPQPKPATLVLPNGWSWKELRFILPKGWTHLRLSLELLFNPPDLFFSPAHEIPFLHMRGTKIVGTVHDVIFRHAPRSYAPRSLRRQEWAIRWAVRQTHALLAVSEATKRDLIDLYHVRDERVTVTPLGLRSFTESLTEQAVLSRCQLTAGQYLLFVGRVEEKKNLTVLLDAFIGLKTRLGASSHLKLAFAGKMGYGGKTLESRAAASAVAKDICFLGYVADADLPALYRNATAFVFPSHGEGFGLPVLEAMSFGAPVVASEVPALQEVAAAAALFVPPDDVSAWIVALEKVITDQALAAELKKKGQVHALDFSWPKTAALTWQVIRKLCPPT